MLKVGLNTNWLIQQSELNGNSLAIVNRKETITYNQLRKKVENRAAKLNEIKEKDIVAIEAKQGVKFVVDLLAVWSIGAIALPINPNLTKEEIEKQIKFIGCKRIKNNYAPPESSIKLKKFSLDKPALIMFTSGSTGAQKAVVHTFETLFKSAESIDKLISFQENEKWLASLPFYRIGGFQILVRALLSGGTIILPDELKSTEILKSIKTFHLNYISIVNATLSKILESNENNKNWKAIFVGGGPVNSELMRKAINQELPVYKVYGSTETGSMISILKPDDALLKIDSAGKPLPNIKVEITDNEITVESKTLFKEYFRNETLTKSKLIREKYFTGDEGYIDEDGFLYIDKRKDNFIISGGEKINLEEVESALISLKKIDKAAVIGLEDEKWGKKVCAVITTNDDVELREIKTKLKEKLPAYKIPKEIKLIEKMPVDEMGKINRKEIEKLFH